MKLKSFMEFINESENTNADFIKRIATFLLNKVKDSSKDESHEYSVFAKSEFTSPFEFDLFLELRRDSNPDLDSDSHFNGLSWEITNFNNLGYCIDANTIMNGGDLLIPEIRIHLILNPRKEPISYEQLFYRLIDILTHETNHLDQHGINRDAFNVQPSTKKDRDAAKKSYKYFLLPDEIESMIEGMYIKSKESGKELDIIFLDYLSPFINNGFMKPSELEEVMNTWIIRSLEVYPDAKFSNDATKIINSI
jgi:hypothetical protein